MKIVTLRMSIKRRWKKEDLQWLFQRKKELKRGEVQMVLTLFKELVKKKHNSTIR